MIVHQPRPFFGRQAHVAHTAADKHFDVLRAVRFSGNRTIRRNRAAAQNGDVTRCGVLFGGFQIIHKGNRQFFAGDAHFRRMRFAHGDDDAVVSVFEQINGIGDTVVQRQRDIAERFDKSPILFRYFLRQAGFGNQFCRAADLVRRFKQSDAVSFARQNGGGRHACGAGSDNRYAFTVRGDGGGSGNNTQLARFFQKSRLNRGNTDGRVKVFARTGRHAKTVGTGQAAHLSQRVGFQNFLGGFGVTFVCAQFGGLDEIGGRAVGGTRFFARFFGAVQASLRFRFQLRVRQIQLFGHRFTVRKVYS